MATQEGDRPESISTDDTKTIQQVVSDSSSALPERHPLQNKWVLWYFKPDKHKTWTDNLKEIISFDTEGVQPMWEDKTNKDGGRWLLTLDRRERKEGTVDYVWMETLMCLVGEVFDDSSDDVCGAVVQSRPKGDKISIWTSNARNNEHILRIGHIYKEKLQVCIHGKFSMQYQSHRDVATKTGSVSKNLHII